MSSRPIYRSISRRFLRACPCLRRAVASWVATSIRKAPVILKKKMASAGYWGLYSVLSMEKARLADCALVGGVQLPPLLR